MKFVFLTMRSLHRILSPFALSLLLQSLAYAKPTFEAKCIGVSDGDTITVLDEGKTQHKIRLEAIDAPESHQEFGEKSKQALSKLVFGKILVVEVAKKDRYGRSVAWIKVNGTEVNRAMIADGWAWHYKQYNSDPLLAKLEQTARDSKIGLWAGKKPTAPWEFRKPKKKKEAFGVVEPYWLNSNGVRHNSGCRWYGKTKRGRMTKGKEGRACGICGG